MATIVTFLLYTKLLAHFVPGASSFTHWVVTEDGRIQAQWDSIFSLRRPYDLMALLKQEERAVMLESLKHDLLNRKEEIDRNEDKDTGLEQRFYKTDYDCVEAGKPLPEYDLFISTVLPLENKGIRPEEHIDFAATPQSSSQPPYCTEISDLDYSIHAFEHLQGVYERENLTISPELGLKNAIPHRDNVDDYGHLIYEAMKKNSTSWVLYNMAAFYWRIKGDAYQVVECVRRALHYSPTRMEKDVALISLANVLHRARLSHEAAVVVHAALDVSRELNVNHFTLGNIYAVLADYNKSVVCFENTLKIQPDFEAAAKRKHAVLCHAKLESALEAQHRSLQQTLTELKDYQHKHEYWQTQQERLLRDQEIPQVRQEQRMGYEWHRTQFEEHVQSGEFCRMEEHNGIQMLQCSWGRKSKHSAELTGTWSSDATEQIEPPEKPMPAAPLPVIDGTKDYMEPVHDVLFTHKHLDDPTVEIERPYKNADWPSKDECDSFVQKFPAWNEFPTTYLPAENKGFEVKALLSSAQGLTPDSQHPLPWYPPVCIALDDVPDGSERAYDHITSVAQRNKVPLRLLDHTMRDSLLTLVDNQDITGEEIGQRILTALKANIGPRWLLYNLAALYWRVSGNSYHGIECLRRSLFLVPEKYKDVPLNNLANILYKWGRVDDAVLVMRDAIATNSFEPESQFFLGSLLSAKGNMTGSVWHYEAALNQQPSHVDAFATMRTMKCYQKYHRHTQSAMPHRDLPRSIHADSVVVCKKENGRENCVVETPLPHLGNQCEGICRQTCTVTPIMVDTCTGAGSSSGTGGSSQGATGPPVTMDHMDAEGGGHFVEVIKLRDENGKPLFDVEKLQKMERLEQLENLEKPTMCSGRVEEPPIYPECPPATSAPPSNCGGNMHQEPYQPVNPTSDVEFNVRLDEVSEHYRQKGLCSGDDCHKLMVQCFTPIKTENGAMHALSQQQFVYKQAGSVAKQCMHPSAQKPHTRLDVVDGTLQQKLIFIEDTNDIKHSAGDCIIYNDGSKSEGCSNEQFESYISDIEGIKRLTARALNQQGVKSDHIHFHFTEKPFKFDSPPPTYQPPSSPPVCGQQCGCGCPSQSTCGQPTCAKPAQCKSAPTESESSPAEPPDAPKPPAVKPLKFSIGDIIKFKPDLARHISYRQEMAWPSWEKCSKEPKMFDFERSSSTWVSFTAKYIDITKYMDFESPVDLADVLEPTCYPDLGEDAEILDLIDGVAHPEHLNYQAETALTEALTHLNPNGAVETLEVMAGRLFNALEEKPSSWVVANLAALYWRVRGDAVNAVTCIKVAYSYAKPENRDIAVLSLANVLHSSGSLDAALTAANIVMEQSSDLVAVHFSVANIYAARGEWGRAIQFYESTLGLHSEMPQAKIRLQAILCDKVLNNPEKYKPKDSSIT